MSASTFDPKKVVVSAGGVPIGNYQKDVFVEISYEEDAVTVRKTVQGSAIFSVNTSDMATVTVRVEPNSNAQRLLSGLFQAQKRTGGGAFVFAIVDNNVPDGATMFHSPETRVAQMPNQGFGHEAQVTEWKLICGESEHFIAELPGSADLPI